MMRKGVIRMMRNAVTEESIADHSGRLIYEESNTAVGYCLCHEKKAYDPEGYLEG